MSWIVQQAAAAVVGAAVGSFLTLAVSFLFFSLVKKNRFGGWNVVIRRGDEVLCFRPVGARKAEEVLDDSSTLSVFIKGVASPFCWLNEDLCSDKAAQIGLFTVSFPKKQWVVDISKNPPAPPKKG